MDSLSIALVLGTGLLSGDLGFALAGTFLAILLFIVVGGYVLGTQRFGYSDLLYYGLHNASGAGLNDMNFGFWEKGESQTIAEASASLSKYMVLAGGNAVTKASKILDIGCGRGGQTVRLAQSTKATVIGLDIDHASITAARKLVRKDDVKNVSFVQGDACSLPFPDNSFDVVTSLESAFHYPCKEAFLFEVRRVLKPGGKLLLADIMINPIWLPASLAQDLLCRSIGCPSGPGRDRVALQESLDSLEFEYKIEDITDRTFVPFYTEFIKQYQPMLIGFGPTIRFITRCIKAFQNVALPFSYVIVCATSKA